MYGEEMGWESSSNEVEFPLDVESRLHAMWEEKKCGFIALTVGIFIQWRKRRKGELSLDVKSHLHPMWEE
jgi:ribosomal protein L31